ncbi:reverse transcriptase domain-containing protein [Tanacetum coccineum]
MREGMFLGYKVNADGLKVCPDKVEAVLSLPSPKCLKDVQRLNGKLASLNRFLSKSAKKSLPFFKTLKKCTKKSDFQWTAKAETAFKQMKTLIAELPMLTAPKEKEELVIYLAAAKEAISAVLMTKENGKQMPIYFAHTIIVITDQPIKQILSNSEVTGRLLKCSFKLGEHDIHYRPRTSVKGQILVDFIMERPEDDPSDTPMEDDELLDPWILFTDGSSCIDATNNEAEYEALIAGLRIAEQMGVKNLQTNVDSWLVANQVNGSYIAKELSMIKYLEKVHCPVPRNPQQNLTPITSSWPFYKWGIDIVGPFPEGPGKVKFLIVAIDYFTKWIEAKPVAAITGAQIKKFVWDNIVCRFGLPGEIISDNGKQFRDNPFKIGAKSYVSANALLPSNIRKPMAA